MVTAAETSDEVVRSFVKITQKAYQGGAKTLMEKLPVSTSGGSMDHVGICLRTYIANHQISFGWKHVGICLPTFRVPGKASNQTDL